jgi:predicted transcriptional regulator
MSDLTVQIAPEALAVAETYLQTMNLAETADTLNISESEVSSYLAKREVKNYVDAAFLDIGYRNRFKLSATLDQIIDKKLAELEESEMGSNKDIADLLTLAHKMRIDELKAQADLIKAEQSSIKQQTNVQINETPFGSGNYGELMQKLLKEG